MWGGDSNWEHRSEVSGICLSSLFLTIISHKGLICNYKSVGGIEKNPNLAPFLLLSLTILIYSTCIPLFRLRITCQVFCLGALRDPVFFISLLMDNTSPLGKFSPKQAPFGAFSVLEQPWSGPTAPGRCAHLDGLPTYDLRPSRAGSNGPSGQVQGYTKILNNK